MLPFLKYPGEAPGLTILPNHRSPAACTEAFSVEIDTIDSAQWSELLREFGDANLYQTWGYQAVRTGAASVSHVLVKQESKVVAAVQARLVRVPLLGPRMAYILWGPLWKRRDAPCDPKVLRQALRAIRAEYVDRRKLSVRIVPRLFEGEDDACGRILLEEGFELQRHLKSHKTILMDISPPLEELNRGLHQKWRNCLNRARKQDIQIIEGEDDALFAAFHPIYDEMRKRKKFDSSTDLGEHRRVQNALPPTEKMRLFLAKAEDGCNAGAICSALGDTGMYLFGATGARGMKTDASYLVQWTVLEWLKQRGLSFYDLNGINPVANEGVYRFKSRLAGKHGREVQFLGRFDSYPGPAARRLLAVADLLRAKLRV